MTDAATLIALAERVEGLVGSANDIDVAIEVMMFRKCRKWINCRANSAGTKVIYTTKHGNEKTYWADDWTVADRHAITAAALRARAKEIG